MFHANSRSKKVLLSIGVLAGIGALAGAGTFASFTAQTTNPGNTFANGTLVLSTNTDGTTCLSTGGGNTDTNSNSTGCGTAFNLTVQKPGDWKIADITLDNKGSLAASDLDIFSGSCTDAPVAAETYHGTGQPCDMVQIYIQQYSDADRTVPLACLYGAAASDVCNFTDETLTLDTFVAAHTTALGGLSAGGLAAATTSSDADTTWISVGVMLPDSADNTYQGQQATMDLNWHLTQTAGTETP